MVEKDLSAREKKILASLIKANDYITAAELSKILNVSEKTIYRDLQSIKNKLGEQNIIKQNRGKGYYISQLNNLNDIFNYSSSHNNFYGIDVDTRRRNILILLLLQTPTETSINKLAELYYISNASIVNDLNTIEQELTKHNLSLIRSRNGTHIEGKEIYIRKLLMQKINDIAYTNESYLLNDDDSDTHNLYTFFSPKDISFVKLLLNKAEEVLYGKIKDPYYINIFTHILILLKRLENNEKLLENTQLIDYKYSDPIVKECTRIIVNNLEKYLNIKIPTNEIYHIYQYLYSSRIDTDSTYENLDFNTTSSEENTFVNFLLKSVSNTLNLNLTYDNTLKNSLLLHIRPLKKRIENNIFISNPLKNDIKKDFSNIFNIVKQILEEQTIYPNFQKLSDDELAYIAVYFQVALEKRTLQKRVGIICSTGVGTSHLLAARVKRAFPEWKIIDIVSSNHANKFNSDNIDLILTTVKLDKNDVPCILVSAIFSDVDIMNVKQKLNML